MAEPTPPRSDPDAGFPGQASVAPRSPAAVAAGNGVSWWTEGWRLFAASPWVWIAITLVFLLITILASLVPLIGSFASTILAPVLAAGMMAGCRALDRGEALTINHLFAGLSERLGSLLVVGLLCLAGTVAIVVVMMAIAVGTIGMSGISALMSGDPVQGGLTMLATLGLGAMVATLAGMLVALPLMMAYWFAPALVMLRGDEPVAAMKASFVACWINIGSMLVYGLVGIVLAIVATIPFGLGWLVLAPVLATSIYASYKDIFRAPG
jgi:uncharacterized membrane protein